MRATVGAFQPKPFWLHYMAVLSIKGLSQPSAHP